MPKTLSKIEWTDLVWNPVTGCSKVSAGCENCYAERLANRFWRGRKFTDVRCHEERLNQPLTWKKPALVFVNSMSDLFHPKVPTGFIYDCWKVMEAAPWHTFLILTKRPQKMRTMLRGAIWGHENPLPNVWLGVSIEDQKTADYRIPLLLQTPAALRFVSAEPLLEEIDLSAYMRGRGERRDLPWLDWVICGGESGPKKRPFNIAWARSLMFQCRVLKTPFFMKQIDKKTEIPKDLMIRQFPKKQEAVKCFLMTREH